MYETIIGLFLPNLVTQLKTIEQQNSHSVQLHLHNSQFHLLTILLHIPCSIFNSDIHKPPDCCIFRIVEKGREFHSFVPNLFFVQMWAIYVYPCSLFIYLLFFLLEIRNARYHSSNCSQLLLEWSSRNWDDFQYFAR